LHGSQVERIRRSLINRSASKNCGTPKGCHSHIFKDLRVEHIGKIQRHPAIAAVYAGYRAILRIAIAFGRDGQLLGL
ncbi:MAG: hypothetical protein VXA66_09635, partial [Alphaproteobacteria bacterium]